MGDHKLEDILKNDIVDDSVINKEIKYNVKEIHTLTTKLAHGNLHWTKDGRIVDSTGELSSHYNEVLKNKNILLDKYPDTYQFLCNKYMGWQHLIHPFREFRNFLYLDTNDHIDTNQYRVEKKSSYISEPSK